MQAQLEYKSSYKRPSDFHIRNWVPKADPVYIKRYVNQKNLQWNLNKSDEVRIRRLRRYFYTHTQASKKCSTTILADKLLQACIITLTQPKQTTCSITIQKFEI